MQKSTKLIAILALIAIGTFATDSVYGQSSDQEIVAFQVVEIVTVSATVFGAIISVYDGYTSRPSGEDFSKKKLLSAIITAIMTSMLLINFDTLPEQTSGMSLFAIAIGFLILGWGADKGLSKLDRTNVK